MNITSNEEEKSEFDRLTSAFETIGAGLNRIGAALETGNQIAAEQNGKINAANDRTHGFNDKFEQIRKRELELAEIRHNDELWESAAKKSMTGVWAAMGALAYYASKFIKKGPREMGLPPEVAEAAEAFQEPPGPPSTPEPPPTPEEGPR